MNEISSFDLIQFLFHSIWSFYFLQIHCFYVLYGVVEILFEFLGFFPFFLRGDGNNFLELKSFLQFFKSLMSLFDHIFWCSGTNPKVQTIVVDASGIGCVEDDVNFLNVEATVAFSNQSSESVFIFSEFGYDLVANHPYFKSWFLPEYGE